MLPAPAQGCLGIEIKKTNKETKQMIQILHHEKSAVEVIAERSFLEAMGGGCRAPLGALGLVKGDDIILEGVFNNYDQNTLWRVEITGKKQSPLRLGKQAASKLKKTVGVHNNEGKK